jgi:endonuclease/exonuclease/phosphatase family metal-dependent hydrolase
VILRKFAKKTILGFNLFFGAVLLFSYLAPYLNPENYWPFAFLGLMYPGLLIINAGFVILWIIYKKKYFLISLVVIVFGFSSVRKTVQIPFTPEPVEKTIKPLNLLSYNVRLFNYYEWDNKSKTINDILNFVNEKDPDLVCFQEFMTKPGGQLSEENIAKKIYPLKFRAIHYHSNSKINYGLATYSRYPIVNSGYIEFDNSLNHCIYTDILSGSDTIRIFNCHLQSIRFTQQNIDFLDTIKFQYSERQMYEIKDLSFKLRDAFIKRSEQAHQIAEMIEGSPYPVILAGDFNDTPFSYTYRIMRAELEDSFINSGKWFSNTYRGNGLSFRIDYVFHDPGFNTVSYSTPRVKYSDHYPLLVKLGFNK